MTTPENQSYNSKEIDTLVQSLLKEMDELLNQSKANPSGEISQKLAECFQKMDTLQQQIKQQMISHK